MLSEKTIDCFLTKESKPVDKRFRAYRLQPADFCDRNGSLQTVHSVGTGMIQLCVLTTLPPEEHFFEKRQSKKW